MARPRDEISFCSICGSLPVGADFPRLVCRRCDALALNDAARPAEGPAWAGGGGDNPVYIDGKQCWRRYGQDGWVTMLDLDNCRDFGQFCKVNRLPEP